jgi:K+-transporting ATPase ATPase C chain
MKPIVTSLRLLAVLTLLTGIIYPLIVSIFADSFFLHKAGGSLVLRDGKVIGSELISQKFTQEKYFFSRPSAIDYNPLPSGGSNLAPTSKKLGDFVKEQETKLGGRNAPADLIYASASGLDPEITLEAAVFQIDRILKARGWDEAKREEIHGLIRRFAAPRQLGFLGEKRVNVLALNLALDGLG